MKKFLSLILSSIIITTCFAGCGDSSTENSANEEVSNEYEEETKGGGIFNVADETEQTEEISDVVTTVESKHKKPDLIETDPCEISIETFVNNFNAVVPELFESKFADYGLSTDLLWLDDEKIVKGSEIGWDDSLTVHQYYLCDSLFELEIYEVSEKANTVYKCTIEFKDREINAETESAKTILSDEQLVSEILTSMFAPIYNFSSLEEIDNFINDANLRVEKARQVNGVPATISIRESDDLDDYRLSCTIYFGGNVEDSDEEQTTEIPTTSETKKSDTSVPKSIQSEILDALDYTYWDVFDSVNSYLTYGEAITTVFSNYTLGFRVDEDNPDSGSYIVSVSGNYYPDYDSFKVGRTSYGSCEFMVVLVPNGDTRCYLIDDPYDIINSIMDIVVMSKYY